MSKTKLSETYIPCTNADCENRASQYHHAYSQTKISVEAYGRKLIDAEFNLFPFCADDHISHRKIPKELIWDEMEFRRMAKKYGIDIMSYPGTKTFQLKRLQGKV